MYLRAIFSIAELFAIHRTHLDNVRMSGLLQDLALPAKVLLNCGRTGIIITMGPA